MNPLERPPRREPLLATRRRGARSWPLAGLLGGLVLLAPTRAAGQPATAGGLTLEELLRITLASNTDLKLAATEVSFSQATQMAAAEPFDSALALVVSGTHGYQFSPPEAPPSTAVVRGVTAAASWGRRFRNGFVIGPEVNASRTRVHQDPTIDGQQVAARLKLTAPLLRDRGGVIIAAPEQAAGIDYAASIREAQQAQAVAMLQAAAAYWSYLAAERRLEVLTASEERARRDVDETAALVKADERTGADLIQAQGYHSSRRAARIAAEQQRLDAGRQLALLSGGRWESLSALPRPITDFPDPRPSAYQGQAQRWIEQATHRRADLAAADLRLRSAELRWQAARNELSARLDLEVSAGYAGQSRGLGGVLHRDFPGAEAGITVSYQLPIERRGVRGRVGQSAATAARQQIVRADIERRIYIGVLTAFEIVKNTQLGLRESAEAVKLMQRTVDNEKKKFRLGSTTLFSVNQAEESLTSALLAMIEGRREFAVALATLRFETGTVFAPDHDRDRDHDGGGGSAETARQLTSFPD
jgi:outer membrane protein TolC